jgi:hypothetical protein
MQNLKAVTMGMVTAIALFLAKQAQPSHVWWPNILKGGKNSIHHYCTGPRCYLYSTVGLG